MITASGCQGSKPRLRVGAYFGAPLGIYCPDPDNLGKHGYKTNHSEKIGLVYTCSGGFIDLGHLRDAADRTAFCAKFTYDRIMEGKTEFSLTMLEPSVFNVSLTYPQNWENFADKENVAEKISLEIGRYMAFNATVWHEIITYYGFKYTGIFSETISAFSWEDMYSDLLGSNIAAEALHDETNNFDDAVTILIDKELRKLNVQPAKTAQKAIWKVYGRWYRGLIYPFVALSKRNLDIGLDDGMITPWLVPGICADSKPISYYTPDFDSLTASGFSFRLLIEPKVWEGREILRIIYPDGKGKYVEPAKDFPAIMENIAEKEKERNGPEFNVPKL